MYEPTGQPYCEPSCVINNGGCATNEICSLKNVTCIQPPCPSEIECSELLNCLQLHHNDNDVFIADPCKGYSCPTGSQCEVFEPSSEAYCEASCDLNNGGCASNQKCSLQNVQCVRAPCPPVVQCQTSE